MMNPETAYGSVWMVAYDDSSNVLVNHFAAVFDNLQCENKENKQLFAMPANIIYALVGPTYTGLWLGID